MASDRHAGQQRERQQLEAGIAALQAQRGVLGDAVVDASVQGLRDKLAALVDAAARSAGAGAPLPPAPAPPQTPPQTLKQVTILFLDIVGSTALSQQLDPEDIHAVIDGALARCSAIVAAHRGKVLQYAGDSLLAAFGADASREDDPERAVHAGLALLEEGRLLGDEVLRRHGHAGFALRLGLHTGEVLLGGGVDAAASIRGIAVNIGARMEQTAPAGGLRISHDTYRHVSGMFEVEPQPPLTVKGVDRPLVTYLVQRAKPRQHRQPSRGVAGIATPMVGRDDALQRLQAAFADLHADAAGGTAAAAQVVTVVADAGIGKSRLLQEFQRWTDAQPAPFVVFVGRAQPRTQAEPYGLLRDMLAWRLRIGDGDTAAVARVKLGAAVAPLFQGDDDGDGAGDAHAHLLGHLIGLDFSASPHVRGIAHDARQIRARGFHAGAELVRRMVGRVAQPALLILDDLHWADDGTLDFVDHLLDANADTPMLVLALARPTLYERRPGWPGASRRQQRIDLQPLGASHSSTLADALLRPIGEVPMALRELINQRAEGNPFYMEELLKMLIDAGAILVDRQPWQVLADKLLTTEVPASLIGVLQARLDTLAASDRRVLQRASVIGVVFWDQAVERLGIDAPPAAETAASAAADAADALASLPRRELILPREPSTFAGTREFAFKHQILQQVTYQSLLKRERRAYHARAAAWLVAMAGDREAEHLGAAAEHYELAGDRVNACRQYARAAQRAAERGANSAMLAFVDRALALAADADHALRWQLLAVRERFLITHDDRARHAADLDAMQALADVLDDDARRADVIWRRAFALDDTGDFAAAARLAQRGIDLALAAGATEVAVKCYAGLGYDLMRMGSFGAAQQAVDRGLALARAGGLRSLEPHFLTDAGGIARAQGDLAAAQRHFGQALAITRELGNRGNEAVMLNNLGDTALRMGDFDTAERHLRASVDVARSTGNRTSEALALQNLAALAHQRGDHAQARSGALAALAIQQPMGLRQPEGNSLLVLGHAEQGLGHLAAAEEAYRRARALFEAVDMQPMAMEALAGLARVALAQRDMAAARQAVDRLLAHRDRGGDFDGTEEPLRIMLSCWQVLAAAADPRAAALLDAARGALKAQADQLADPLQRRQLLEVIPHHRDIERAWAERRPGPDEPAG